MNNIESTILTDFNGTWTALNSQLQLAGIVESLAEAIHVTNLTDLSGVFTSLAMLQHTIEVIDSLVDVAVLVDNQNLMLACSIESKVEQTLSKLSVAQAEFLPLPNLNNSTISLLSADSGLLYEISSAVDVGLALLISINSQVDRMIPTVSVIDNGLIYSNSTLPIISNNLVTIESKLSTVNTSSSLLSVIDSKLLRLNNASFTIESIIDHILSQLGVLAGISQTVSRSALVASKLSVIPAELLTVSSNIDQLILVENTINSTTDVITRGVQSSLALASTIDSKVNAIASIVEVASGITLNSKLAVINNQTTTIGSKLSIVDAGFQGLIFTAQDMATDFQETWTILQSISNILTSDQLGLQTISSKISRMPQLDLTGVYTAINRIIVQESTVNTQVDTANSLADRINSKMLEFSSVFTALSAVSGNLNTINSQVDLLNTHVNTASTYWGTPIYNVNIPLTISQPGRYYLAENINYNGASDIITINSYDVCLDLNGYTIGGSQRAITVNAVNNIQIINGIINASDDSISLIGSTNVILKNLLLKSSAGACIVMQSSVNIIVESCVLDGGILAIVFYGVNNVTIKDVHSVNAGHQVFEFSGLGSNNLCMANINYSGIAKGGTSLYGFACQGTNKNFLLENSIFMSLINKLYAFSHQSGDGNGLTVKNCTMNGFGNGVLIRGPDLVLNSNIIGSYGVGIQLESSNGVVLFNTLVNNGFRNIFENGVGPNTYLGNFAFSQNATGNPNNTNYTISGSSNITNKYQTLSQSGSFGDFVTGWHNINMLP